MEIVKVYGFRNFEQGIYSVQLQHRKTSVTLEATRKGKPHKMFPSKDTLKIKARAERITLSKYPCEFMPGLQQHQKGSDATHETVANIFFSLSLSLSLFICI